MTVRSNPPSKRKPVKIPTIQLSPHEKVVYQKYTAVKKLKHDVFAVQLKVRSGDILYAMTLDVKPESAEYAEIFRKLLARAVTRIVLDEGSNPFSRFNKNKP